MRLTPNEYLDARGVTAGAALVGAEHDGAIHFDVRTGLVVIEPDALPLLSDRLRLLLEARDQTWAEARATATG